LYPDKYHTWKYVGLHPLLYQPNNNALLFLILSCHDKNDLQKMFMFKLCLKLFSNFFFIKSYCASRYVVCDSTRLYRQFSIRNSTPQPLKAFLSYRTMCGRTDRLTDEQRYTIIRPSRRTCKN
jgi:hypothetical protein